jgi:hypothetical protein
MDGAISEVLGEALKALQEQQAAEGRLLADKSIALLSKMAGEVPGEGCRGTGAAVSVDLKLQELLDQLQDAPMRTRYVYLPTGLKQGPGGSELHHTRHPALIISNIRATPAWLVKHTKSDVVVSALVRNCYGI